MPKEITIIHISDLHFTNNQNLWRGFLENRQFFSKRHIGWLNYRLRRRHSFDPSIRDRLLEKLKSIHWDYLIVTGDITTIALKREFAEARKQMSPLIEQGSVLLTAGNHDRYVKNRSSIDPLQHYFSDCWPLNVQGQQGQLPRIYEIDQRAVVVELDMAVPRSVFSSRGKLRQELDPLRQQLKKLDKNKLKIAIGHYPAYLPPNEHEGYFHRLSERSKLQGFLEELDFDFYLHGHIHKSWAFKPDETKSLICVNSGGCCRHDGDSRWGGFHKILFSEQESSIERIIV